MINLNMIKYETDLRRFGRDHRIYYIYYKRYCLNCTENILGAISSLYYDVFPQKIFNKLIYRDQCYYFDK
jgi:hypothetical protein